MTNWHTYLKPAELHEVEILAERQMAIRERLRQLHNRAKQRKHREARHASHD